MRLILNFQNRGYSLLPSGSNRTLLRHLLHAKRCSFFIFGISLFSNLRRIISHVSIALGEKPFMCMGHKSLQHQYCCLHIKLALLQHFHCLSFALSPQLGAETEA